MLVGFFIGSRLSGQPILWALLVCTLGSTICLQIATNWFNDALDFQQGKDTAARVGPRRITAAGVVSPASVMMAAMLMLGVARRTAQHDAAVRRGEWNVRNRFETVELDGKTLLLVGFGRIGRRVAQLAQAFGMTVMAYDPFVKPELLAKHGVRPASDLVKALGQADYVSLHMPGTTAGAVIWEEEIAAMKPSAILINAARGLCSHHFEKHAECASFGESACIRNNGIAFFCFHAFGYHRLI